MSAFAVNRAVKRPRRRCGEILRGCHGMQRRVGEGAGQDAQDVAEPG